MSTHLQQGRCLHTPPVSTHTSSRESVYSPPAGKMSTHTSSVYTHLQQGKCLHTLPAKVSTHLQQETHSETTDPLVLKVSTVKTGLPYLPTVWPFQHCLFVGTACKELQVVSGSIARRDGRGRKHEAELLTALMSVVSNAVALLLMGWNEDPTVGWNVDRLPLLLLHCVVSYTQKHTQHTHNDCVKRMCTIQMVTDDSLKYLYADAT